MPGLFSRPIFPDFGPSAFLPGEPAALTAYRGRPSRLRLHVRDRAPRLPGVYGMADASGELIYVGKAKCLRSRLLSYFRPASRNPKAGRILDDTRLLLWEVVPSEFGALLRELELIRRWRPRFNVQGQPRRRRRVYLCVGRKPAPYAFVSGRPPAGCLGAFGPVPAGDTVRAAARHINDLFRLRDCPRSQTMIFADQRELFPLPLAPGCLRHEIGTCLAPCAAVCTRDTYGTQARAALAFLTGADLAPLAELERAMTAAAADLAFERAAALRDRLEPLRWLRRHLDRLSEAAVASFVYPAASHDGSSWWYLVRRGRAVGAVEAPRDEPGRARAAAALAEAFAPGRVAPGPLTPEEIDGVVLVAGWFRRYPAEKERVLTPEQARAACGF